MGEIDPQLMRIVELALSALPVEIGCDDCFKLLAAYVEHRLSGTSMPDSMTPVEEHLARCAWCTEELELVLEAVRAERGDPQERAAGPQTELPPDSL